MATIPKVESKEMALLKSHKTMPVKNIAFDMQGVVTDPIDPKRISKGSTSKLTISSAVKAGLVFAGTIGLYHLFKNVNVFSYFGLFWIRSKKHKFKRGS
jgi:hypothetical protein